MSDASFDPPPLSAWLLVASCGLIFMVPYLGDAPWAAWVVLGCGLYGIAIVTRWVGRWIGLLAHGVVTGAVEGYQEGVAEARQRRQEKSAVAAPPTSTE